VSGVGEWLGGMLRQPDQRDTAAVLAIAGPLLLVAAAVRTMASPFFIGLRLYERLLRRRESEKAG